MALTTRTGVITEQTRLRWAIPPRLGAVAVVRILRSCLEMMVAQVAVVVSVTIQLITVDQGTRPPLLRHRAAMVVRDMRGLGQAVVVEAIQP